MIPVFVAAVYFAIAAVGLGLWIYRLKARLSSAEFESAVVFQGTTLAMAVGSALLLKLPFEV